jgi:hypothetical protein
MAIKLPPLPRGVKLDIELQIWLETLWQRVRGNVTTSGDADHSIGSGVTYHGVTALSAGRTLTLPDASLLQDGEEIVIQDESGDAGTHNITIVRQGTDTINGVSSVDITSDFGRLRVIKRGPGEYYSA